MKTPSASHLSERTKEVLALVEQGLTAPQIADQLGISRNAVYQQQTKLRKEGYLPSSDAPRARPSVGTSASLEQILSRFTTELHTQRAQLAQRLEDLHEEEKNLKTEIKRLDMVIKKQSVLDEARELEPANS